MLGPGLLAIIGLLLALLLAVNLEIVERNGNGERIEARSATAISLQRIFY